MQSLVRSTYSKATLLGTSRRALRCFAADLSVKAPEQPSELDLDARNKRMGVDTVFNEQKHAYVLTFPWNYQEVIADYEGGARPVPAYWDRWIHANGDYEINKLFRDFH